MNESIIDYTILEQCKREIKEKIGTIKDLPPELANSLANFYYRYFLILNELSNGSLPSIVSKNKDIFKGLKQFSYESEKILSFIGLIPEQVHALRQFKSNGQPNLYKMWTDLMLDIYKYDIKNATRKIGLRRFIERKFKNVKEIDGLSNYMP